MRVFAEHAQWIPGTDTGNKVCVTGIATGIAELGITWGGGGWMGMKISVTAIKADIGSIGGHLKPSQELLAQEE